MKDQNFCNNINEDGECFFEKRPIFTLGFSLWMLAMVAGVFYSLYQILIHG